jgi:hypothetical protein
MNSWNNDSEYELTGGVLTESMMSELFPYSQPAFNPSPAWYDQGELSEVEPEQEPPRNTRRIGGNNPYGSRGCRSCITCRKRKGKVFRNPAMLTEVRVRTRQ